MLQTADPRSSTAALSAALVCRLCGTPITSDESSAMVGAVTLHLECWIIRMQSLLSGHTPAGSF